MWYLLLASTTFAYTRQDTLRGSNGSGRSWWDVQHYSLTVTFDTAKRTISGSNVINLLVTASPGDSLQLDLQELMFLDSVKWKEQHIDFTKEGNVWWLKFPFKQWSQGSTQQLTAYYHGKPREAKMPPWDGGFIWTNDSMGKPWIAVACQGLGASSWWPCKDAQWDEPDGGMDMIFKLPKDLQCVSNGQMFIGFTNPIQGEMRHYRTQVKNPINSYNVTFYIGDYTGWKDTLMGEKGKLDLNFHVLRYNEEKARKQFAVTKQMLHCFEYWMGPYPFYEDGYKLVEAPYLGMEHQSAIAYGNEYKMGYRGTDRSGTGVGLLFDFIIIHESGHEWFGNNITAKDVADNWLHEGFTTYTEVLFSECAFGKEKSFEYNRGKYRHILNDRPVIGNYGVNDDGSSDKYNKGAAVIHMIRMMIDDDEKFRQMLRKMNETYYHKTVSSAEIEAFIIASTGLQLQPFFDQYLRTKDITEIEWYIEKNRLHYRFTNTVPGFSLPLQVTAGRKKENIRPTSEWQSVSWKRGGYNISFSEEFLIKPKS